MGVHKERTEANYMHLIKATCSVNSLKNLTVDELASVNYMHLILLLYYGFQPNQLASVNYSES